MSGRRGSRRQPVLPIPGGWLLRPWSTADAPALLMAHRDPLVARYATVLLSSRAQAEAVITTWSPLWSGADGAAWALVDPGGNLGGALIFVVKDRVSRRAEVGYWLTQHARGQGLATAALRAGSDVAFDACDWHRIDLSHAVGNERSCALARRCGYRAEAVLRQAQFYPESGTWCDEHLHARLATD